MSVKRTISLLITLSQYPSCTFTFTTDVIIRPFRYSLPLITNNKYAIVNVSYVKLSAQVECNCNYCTCIALVRTTSGLLLYWWFLLSLIHTRQLCIPKLKLRHWDNHWTGQCKQTPANGVIQTESIFGHEDGYGNALMKIETFDKHPGGVCDRWIVKHRIQTFAHYVLYVTIPHNSKIKYQLCRYEYEHLHITGDDDDDDYDDDGDDNDSNEDNVVFDDDSYNLCQSFFCSNHLQ